MIVDRKSLDERLLGKGSKTSKTDKYHTTNQFIYLYGSYKRLRRRQGEFADEGVYAQCRSLIVNILRSLVTILDDSTTMSIKFVGLVKIDYLDDEGEDEAVFEEFFDLFMAQFEPSEAEWAADETTPLVSDPVELTFFEKIFSHLNSSLIDMDKCEDFTGDYVKYLKLVNLLARSKLMKYLLVSNSFLPKEVNFSTRISIKTIFFTFFLSLNFNFFW